MVNLAVVQQALFAPELDDAERHFGRAMAHESDADPCFADADEGFGAHDAPLVRRRSLPFVVSTVFVVARIA
jgi:hypothetical protein